MYDVTILMPCLNESQTLAICINKAKGWAALNNVNAEILIADNGSIDRSQLIAENLGARVVDVKKRGYGAALIAGANSANSSFIIMADSDDSYDFSNLNPFYEKLKEGFDLVMGNRFLGGIERGAMPWKNRYIGNPSLTFIGKMLFNCKLNDFHCGLRGFTKSAFEKMNLKSTGMEFNSEMVFKANILDMKICEVPTTLAKDGRDRPPHLKPWRDGWRNLRLMLLFSPEKVLITPSITLLLLLTPIYILLYRSSLQIGTLNVSLNTLMITGTLIVVSYLSLLLGSFVKKYGEDMSLFPYRRNRLSSFLVSFETSIVSGLLQLIFSFVLVLVSFGYWKDAGFSEINILSISKQTFSASMLAITGIVTIAFGFVAGLRNLPES